jgi:hypothetical protein
MDKVLKQDSSKCILPSSEPFGIEILMALLDVESQKQLELIAAFTSAFELLVPP